MVGFINSIVRFLVYPFVRRGELKDGVSALVCCRDEEYNITLCLESLLGSVDQIVCIDHNSSDQTYSKMLDFQDKYSNRINIIVQQFNGTSLKDARNFGLQSVQYNWLLNCGGDFVFDIEKPEVFKLFSSLKENQGLAAFRLAFINLYGDLKHTYSNSVIIGKGEYYLVKLTKGVFFKENGKFDYLAFPFYYNKKSISEPYFFHLSGMKNDMRLIYRNCYFEWREIYNYLNSKGVKNSPYFEYDYFSLYWNNYLFQTNDVNSLKYRYMRQLCELSLQKYDKDKIHPYPKVINDIIDFGYERFEIKYHNNKPYIRIDKEDKMMTIYEPTSEDLNWSVANFKEKIYAKEYLKEIKLKYK